MTHAPITRRLAALAALAAAVLPGAARPEDAPEPPHPPLADTAPQPRALTGTLARVQRAGVLRLGHRTDAVPFAFLDPRGRPVGYALDLCRAVAEDVGRELGLPDLRVELVPVTAEDRLSRVAAGEVDLECGSTTSTAARRRLVAFSPTTFVSATRLLVRRDATTRAIADLRGRAVAAVRGSTAVDVVRDLSARSDLSLRLVEVADYGEALRRLDAGAVDAVAGDAVLLAGLLAERGGAAAHRLVGPPLSHEPYALAFQRDDPALAAVVARTFRRLAESREIERIYARWFVRALPSGARLRLPMGAELEALWRIQGLPADGS